MVCPAKFRGRTNQSTRPTHGTRRRVAEFGKLQAGIAGMRRLSGEPQHAAGAARVVGTGARETRAAAGHESRVVWLAAWLAAVADADAVRCSWLFITRPLYFTFRSLI